MSDELSNLSDDQLDALQEVGNIGAGNAATALAQMLQTKIEMNIPKVRVVPFSQVAEYVGGPDSHVAGIYLIVDGEAPASVLFITPIQKTCLLVDMLLGKQPGTTNANSFDVMDVSAIMELGNIISATYLNALAMVTRLSFSPSVPALAIDMAGAILDAILAQLGEIAEHVLLIETQFNRDGQDVLGYFFLLPEPGSLNTILNALGVNS